MHDIGKHVPMSQMLGRDFVKQRLGEGGSGISYGEFSYSLIQAYDFLHLNRTHNVTLQLCGADQWGNSIAGVDLIRRLESREAHVYSTPLVINKATGVKFGKTEGGAVWLDPTMMSVYKFYQFWLNVDDEGVIEYAKIYTLLTQEEIEAMAENHAANPGARSAQRALARAVTDIVHGRERRESVERVTEVLFGGESFESLSLDDLDTLAGEIPSLAAGSTLVFALVTAGFAKSNGEARRLLEGGAVSVNGTKVQEDMLLETTSLVKKGKNSFALVG